MVEKVTKDPEAVARSKKSWEKHMENIKKKHLDEIRAGDKVEDAVIVFGIAAVLLYTKKHQVLEMLKRVPQQSQPPPAPIKRTNPWLED